MSVATLHRAFPHEAKKIRRLMGFLKAGEKVKVNMIKIVPVTEKQDATRSVVSRARSWAAVNSGAMAGSVSVAER